MLLIPHCDYRCIQAIKSIPEPFLSPLAEFKVPSAPGEPHIGCHNASRHWRPPKQKRNRFATEPRSCRAGNKTQVRSGSPAPPGSPPLCPACPRWNIYQGSGVCSSACSQLEHRASMPFPLSPRDSVVPVVVVASVTVAGANGRGVSINRG